MGRILRITAWPFRKNEIVKLHWIHSPALTLNREWNISVDFLREDGKIKSVILPWGLLPALRIGATYTNGKIMQPVEGLYGKFPLAADAEARLCKVSDIPVTLNPKYLFPEYSEENVCHIEVDGIVYFIPCIEIVRMYLTPTSTLAKAIVSAGGLEELYRGIEIANGEMHIDLSPDYPTALANEEYMLHFSWLAGTAVNRRTWNSIRNQLINHSGTHPATISCVPPASHDIVVRYCGIHSGNQCFVQFITALEKLWPPGVHKVVYRHPELVKREIRQGERRPSRGKPTEEKETEFEADDKTDYADSSVSVKKAESIPSAYQFILKPKVVRSTSATRTVKRVADKSETVTAIREIRGSCDTDYLEVSARNPGGSGVLPPVDFELLEKVLPEDICGLDAFIRYILGISQWHPDISIQLSVYYIPGGESVSNCEDGSRRQLAIAQLNGLQEFPGYVIEIGRPDDWKTSTLAIQSYSESSAFIHKIGEILDSLMDNYGHWNEDIIRALCVGCDFRMIRHRKSRNHEHSYRKIAEFFMIT